MSEPSRAGTAVGAAAIIGVIACCGLPVLLAAGVLTGAGALLRNALLVGLGLAALAGPVIWASRRTRSGAACDTPPPANGRDRHSSRRRRT